MSLKSTNLRLQSNPPGANELIHRASFNSLAPRRFERNFRQLIFKLIAAIDGSDTACEIALNYTNPGYGLSLVDTLWNVGSYRQPLEQEGNPMT